MSFCFSAVETRLSPRTFASWLRSFRGPLEARLKPGNFYSVVSRVQRNPFIPLDAGQVASVVTESAATRAGGVASRLPRGKSAEYRGLPVYAK